MHKNVIISIFIGIIAVASVVVFFKNSPHIFSPPFTAAEKKQEIFQISFDGTFTHSDLYPPNMLTEVKATNSIVAISWNFPDKKLTVTQGVAPEYALLSGFRIYRDGYWFADIPKNQTTFTDTGLYPDETYTYTVAGLTFDNKIEGSSSAALTVKTQPGPLHAIIFPNKKITSYLAAGDSITEGKQVAEPYRWVSLVGNYLQKHNATVKVINTGVNASLAGGVLDRLPGELRLYTPDLVTIAVGTNDMTGASRDIGNMSMIDYRDTLQKIISLTRSDPNRDIVLLNIYYFGCCDEKRLVWNKLLRDIAHDQGILLVDVENAMENNGKDSLVAGLHPNGAGHAVIANTIIKELQRYLQ
jgi:lysophospholipase L1-like esterase